MKTRKIVGILMLMILTAVFCFATGEAEVKSTASQLANVDPTGQEITYWYQHSGSRGKAMEEQIALFNSTNQWGITVKGEFAGAYNDIYNKMITAIPAKTMPNLTVAYQNQASTYQLTDSLVDLNPYVNDPVYGIKDLDDFFAGFINQDVNSQFDNQRIGFPTNRSMEVVYYNKTWLNKLGFTKAPVTWDDFYAVCKAATGGGKYGYEIRTDASNMFAMVVARGGTIVKADGKGYNLNTPEMKASMQFMKKLYDDGYAIKTAEAYGDQTDFGNSKIMFTMGSTSGLPYYESAVKGSDAPFEWSVAAIPHTTAKAVLDIYGASISVCKSTPEKELASWIFLKWLSEPTQQAYWTRVSNYFPVRYSTANELGDYLEKNPKFNDAFNLLKNSDTKAEPPFAGYDEVRDLMSEAFNKILDGANIDQTLKTLDEEANEVYEFVME